jgi:NTP pyrophosphatase (non-canonical NTP hydrolase)
MNKYRDETGHLCRLRGWDNVTVERVWLLYTEECGELASAIRQNLKYCVKENLKKSRGTDVVLEMGDVFSYLFQLAYMMNIDLDEMWELNKKKAFAKIYAHGR